MTAPNSTPPALQQPPKNPRLGWVRAAFALACAVAALLVVPAAAQDTLPVVGSWTQLRVTASGGPTPDLQSADGAALPVVNTLLGPAAYSAIRYAHTASSLTLTRIDSGSETTSGAPALAPVIWACLPAAVWQAGARQPWDTRPAYDCARHAAGIPNGANVTWNLAPVTLGAHGTQGDDTGVTAVLVPAPGDTAPYSVAFRAPTTDSFGGVAGSAEVTTGPDEPAPSTNSGDLLSTNLSPDNGDVGTTLIAELPIPTAGTLRSVRAPETVAQRPTSSNGIVANPAALGTRQDGPTWPGPALLAFLAFLLMVKAALPTRLLSDPVSLIAVHSERDTH